jgi:broad specificity phosphatase PhoE
MIYLLRHFRVIDTSNNWLDSESFNIWVNAYDTFSLEYKDIKLPIIDEVYCSAMQRCVLTAEYLQLNGISRNELIEVTAQAAFQTRIKLPKLIWLIIDRVLWFFNLKHSENRCDTIHRADAFLDSLDLSKDILIVSHALFLNILHQRLKLRGYEGKKGFRIKNAYLYKLDL